MTRLLKKILLISLLLFKTTTKTMKCNFFRGRLIYENLIQLSLVKVTRKEKKRLKKSSQQKRAQHSRNDRCQTGVSL